MSIPLYFSIFEEEFASAMAKQENLAVYCGSFGSAGLQGTPHRLPPNAKIAVFSDRFLPQSPSSAAQAIIQFCKSAGLTTLLLDFERKTNDALRNLISMLTSTLPKTYTVILPTAYWTAGRCQVLALCAVTAPCSSWAAEMQRFQATFPNQWCLELTPWRVCPKDFCPPIHAPIRQGACCHVCRTAQGLALWDSRQSLQRKIEAAGQHGCRLAIGLGCEMKALTYAE